MNKMFKDSRIWIVTIVLFLLLMTFFDRNNILERQDLKQEIRTLEQQRKYYLNRISDDSTTIERLKDNDFLEQYAREHYLMKSDSDVVFIIPEK